MMHPQKVLRLAELTEFTGLRRSQIEQLVAEGKFPKPVRLSARRKAWLATEVGAWQQERIVRRDQGREA